MQKLSYPGNPENDYYYFETKDENVYTGIGSGLLKRQSPQHTVTNYITVSLIEEFASRIDRQAAR